MSDKKFNLAFVFPGQGSQSVGMLNELAGVYSEVKSIFERGSEALKFDLWKLVTEGSEEELNQTQITQPVMLAAGYAVWEIWRNQSTVFPEWVAGHSLGEYTALVASETMNFEDAIRLVAERGRLMQQAVPPGTGSMAAILGLEDSQVVNLCAEETNGEIVSAVNFNAPGQVVIAGHTAAVERAIEKAKEAGAKRAVTLPVSVPSHCCLMESAAEKLNEILLETAFQNPRMTLIHNVDVASHTAPEVIRNALKEQLYKPVRWVETIKFMHDQGVTDYVECGPGKVLLGLNKRIAKGCNHLAIYNPATLEYVLESLS